MSKSILTIGFELASEAVHHEPVSSKASLLDWDIILFKPLIDPSWKYYAEEYQGKSCLNDTSSFAFKEACEHWRREIKQAIETGKTVVVFLPPLDEVYVATGEKRYSGTGRNTRTNRIVTLYSNYNAIPLTLHVTNSSGSAIKPASHGSEIIAPYWKEFGSMSEYKVLLPSDLETVCLVTRHGDRAVGAIVRSGDSSGTLIMVPDIDFYPDQFFEEKDEDQIWTTEAKTFAARMVTSAVALDNALHASVEITPEPVWAKDAKFALSRELQLRSELLESERLVEKAQKHKEDVIENLKAAGVFRALLYEKGKPLERAIVQALRLLGFNANPYKDSNSEFDVVFEAPEGRLLGEAEGKDSKAINVDKLRQLSMNIHEDLQREDVSVPAKGVLFGNGYRLIPPSERDAQFTTKCVSAARSTSVALVATADLYVAIQYLSEQPDNDYARNCRDTILAGVGLVALPQPPKILTPASPEAPISE